MKRVLVINGSPKKERSYTFKAASAFLEGLNKDNECQIEIIHVSNLNIKPCLGCLSCWGRTEGECVIKTDDIPSLKEKILNADIVIQVFPLYFFGMPGTYKLMTDRLLSMMNTYKGHEMPTDGQSLHGLRYFNPNQKFLFISSCAYSEYKDVYESLTRQLDFIYGTKGYQKIYLPQLMTLMELGNSPRLDRYLKKLSDAGYKFIKEGLSNEECDNLSKLPFTPSTYKMLLQNFWNEQKIK
jgi:multimeric flavodoxin WrbA